MITQFTLAAACLASFVGAPSRETKPLSRNRVIVLIAGTPSHPSEMHEYNAGCTILKQGLDKVKGIETRLCLNGWPKDPAVLEGADAVFLYMDGGDRHGGVQPDHLKALGEMMKRGVGMGCAHYAVEVPANNGGKEWQDWIGGYYETNWSVNPMWEPNFDKFPKHPITRGVKPFTVRDEWYFNMRFRPDMKDVTPILVAKPSDQVRGGPYVAPRGPYAHIQEAKGRDETMMWAVQRPDGGRGFGFTGGHFHVNWSNENYRKAVLNALVWIAKGDVPKNGIESTLSEADLWANLDDKPDRKKR